MEIHRIPSIKSQVALCVLFCISSFSGQSQKPSDDSESEFDKTVTGINDYEIASIRRAGDSDNAAYAPYLHSLLIHSGLATTTIEAAASIALAKLGDAEQMKNIECNLMTSKPGMVDYIDQDMLPEIKAWVGGWPSLSRRFSPSRQSMGAPLFGNESRVWFFRE